MCKEKISSYDTPDEIALFSDKAEVLSNVFQCWYRLYEDGEYFDYDLVGAFLLSFMAIKRRKRWAAGMFTESIASEPLSSVPMHKFPGLLEILDPQYIQKKTGRMYDPNMSIISMFNCLQFFGIKNNSSDFVNRNMVMWCLGQRPFVLLTHIPTPMEVLRMQAAGKRVVTMFLTKQELMSYHIAKLQYMSGQQQCRKDALDFLVHDLKHMDHFTNTAIMSEQVGFFRALLKLGKGHPKRFFRSLFPSDEVLWYELEYLISDMNCYVPHLMKYLLAKLINAIKRKHNVTCIEETGSTDKPFLALLLECVEVWTAVLIGLGMNPPTPDSMRSPSLGCGSLVEANLRELPAEAFVGGMYLLLETHGFNHYFSQQYLATEFLPTTIPSTHTPTTRTMSQVIDTTHLFCHHNEYYQHDMDQNEAMSRLRDLKILCGDITPEVAGESLRSHFKAIGDTKEETDIL